MKKLVFPKTISVRYCPKCGERQYWSVHGFAYPAGDDSKWKCFSCDYKGRPEYKKFDITFHRSS